MTAAEVDRFRPHDSSDLGIAIGGASLRLRNDDGRLTQVGRGELCVAGGMVSPGLRPRIRQRGEVLRARPAPLVCGRNECSIDEAGSVRLHGRLDNMVKIRGQRIELEEVEAVVSRHPRVGSVAVTVAADGYSLVAFLEVEGPGVLARTDLREHCAQVLSEAAIPSRFVTLDALPRSTGKVPPGGRFAVRQAGQ